jgi:DNA mismatch repair ATPase MutS
MILDGFALKSLHLLPPSDLLNRTRTDTASLDADGQRFSLFNTINHCYTPFGRRKLRQWICAPSCDSKVLRERQESIQFLCQPESKTLMEAGKNLAKVPDLERLFQRYNDLIFLTV